MEKRPDSSQTTRARLMEPVPCKTPPGAIKMPEPMMEPTMIEHPCSSSRGKIIVREYDS